MEARKILNQIQKSYYGLWHVQERSNTLEIVTPHLTLNNEFVSVYLTRRRNSYIVSDGGWVAHYRSQAQGSNPEHKLYQRLFQFYLDEYQIEQTDQGPSAKLFYKRSEREALLGALVYDVADFVRQAINLNYLPLEDKRETLERETFRHRMDQYFQQSLGESDHVEFHKELDLSHIRFNAILRRGSRLTLVNYITGSTRSYFDNAIARATVNFELIQLRSIYREVVEHTFCIVNDEAPGYPPEGDDLYLEHLNRVSTRPFIPWSQRERLASYMADSQ